MFSFEYIFFFWALAAVPFFILIYLLSIQRKKKIAKRIGDEKLVKILTAGFSKAKFALKFSLLIIAFIAGVVALANFRSRDSGQLSKRNGIDVMFALDVSNSMLAQDISPSRLDRAKQLVGKIMDKLENDRVGIVVFAGKAYLQMPLTADHSAARLYLSSATPEMIPTQGTVIGDALKMCNLSFNEKDTKYKAVILISDGEDHDENAVSQAEAMAKTGVTIQTIGIGSPQGSTIPDPQTGTPKTDQNGNVVYSKLNESSLNEIAEKGNGSYQLFTGTDPVVSHIISELNRMETREVADDSLYNFNSYFQIFMMLMFIALIAELFTSEKIRETKKLKTAFVALIFFILPSVSNAQSEAELIQQGNTAYKNKDYEKAAALYKQAAAIKNAETTAQYNLGNALYKKGSADEAISSYDNVIKTSKNKMELSALHYNKGVVLQNNKKLEECIAAYKNALRLNPDDEDARWNLQKALQQKKQQEQKQKDKKDKDKKEDQKPQPSKLSQKEAEQKLQALLQQEKNLHDKLKKANSSPVNKPEKDW